MNVRSGSLRGSADRGVQGRRRSLRRVSVLATVMVTALGVLAACGGDDTDSDGGKSTTLTIGIDTGPANLNPALDVYGLYSTMRWLSNDTFLTLNTDGSYGPRLATEWGYVGDGNMAFEMTLRQDAEFSNGKPLDAQAAADWFNYFKSAGGTWAKQVPLKEATAVDEWTVRMEFSEPAANMEFYMSATGWPFVSDVTDPELLSQESVGVGPYKLVADGTVAGQSYVFEANENYYDQSEVRYDKVLVNVMSSPATMLRALQGGQLDVALGNASTVDAADATSGVSVLSVPDAGTVGFDIVDRNGDLAEPLGDVRVRQALNYAIDRETITEAMVGKWAEPTSSWITSDGNVPELRDAYPYDPEKAKELLAEAGYPDGFSFKIVDKSYNGNLGDPMVQAVAADWAKIGVTVDILAAASAAEYYEHTGSGKISVVGSDTTGAPVLLLSNSRFAADGSLNPFKVVDQEIDDLLEQGRSAGPEEAGEYWRSVTERVTEQATQIPVFTNPVMLYFNDSVTGLDKGFSKYFMYTPVLRSAEPK